MPEEEEEADSGVDLRTLRAIRVLRPLKLVSGVPSKSSQHHRDLKHELIPFPLSKPELKISYYIWTTLIKSQHKKIESIFESPSSFRFELRMSHNRIYKVREADRSGIILALFYR